MLTIRKIICIISTLIIVFSCQNEANERNKQLENKLDTALKEIDNLKNKNNDSILRKNEDSLKNIKDSLISTLENIKKPDLSVLYEKLKNSVFVVYTTNNYNTYQGTAFLIESNGLCISNYHIFNSANKGIVQNSHGNIYPIEDIIYSDRVNDLIIFKIALNNDQITPLKISKSNPRVGEECFTIGNPMGLNQTLSKGIISGFRNNEKVIQITAEITHGSSGGPLFNNNGEVIGITSSGIGEANLNFAVNINQIPQNLNMTFTENNRYSDTFVVITERAYFHNEPKISTKRNAYLVKNEIGNVISRKNGFVYIVFKNKKGQVSKGWINTNDISFL